MPSSTATHFRRKMLVVDDEPLIRDLFVDVFDTFEVIQATQGFEALQFINARDIDIVLTDVRMPGLSGMDLLQKIKLERPDLPVILMTGFSDKTLILEALKAGADDFITKPIDILQLATTVDKVIERQTLRDELSNLRHLDQMKNEFLGLVSHKLKTPTSAISLFIQNLAEGVESPDDENFLQIVTMVQTEVVYLEKMIQDLLYFSEVVLQEMEPALEPVALDQVVKQVLAELKQVAATKFQRIEAQIEPVPPLLLPLQRIAFAVRALLDNAVKFTREKGIIQVECRSLPGKIHFSVRDDGIGIPATEMSKIFNKFYQVDPEHTGQVRGFGLGLYYARDFVRAMNGQMIVTSEARQGTVAIIELPLPG